MSKSADVKVWPTERVINELGTETLLNRVRREMLAVPEFWGNLVALRRSEFIVAQRIIDMVRAECTASTSSPASAAMPSDSIEQA